MNDRCVKGDICDDYSTGNPIHIHVYPDEVLVYNDGKLPENWAIEQLFAKHTSKPYNPLIAGAFFRSGQIEAWGRGIEKINIACKEWNKPQPFFRISSNEVMIGFTTDTKFGDKFGDNQTQSNILEMMRLKPTVSAKLIAKEIGITTRSVEKNIRILKNVGLIERVGSAKSGYWVVKT
jgi:ATP-dependent DNA helicase RecG